MFLKRIELAGFKSFADKTELEFVRGITAVVGPNGSGKSNISDGIRWVLGEQSARSLRGGKMEDVIFAGSDSRKAVNYGEVSLTLDNADQALPLDFTEVTVTRRVHRSGDSEYFINKQSCRLRDITELFMDTGIGKEAYSIIGQGRIEEILSTKSEDRRGIFEEASGIVKYKARKKEAEKKLNETEQNVLRIHDLISELEDQIEPLAEQSAKAVQFKLYREELKASEISLYVYQIEEAHQLWTKLTNDQQALEQQQAILAEVVHTHDAELEKHRRDLRRLEEELQQLHETQLSINEEVERCEGQGEVLKERRKNMSSNRVQLEQAIAMQQQRLSDKANELQRFEMKLNEVNEQLIEQQQLLRAEEESLLGVVGGISSELEERLKAELLDLMNDLAQARNEIHYADQQADAMHRRMNRLSEEQSKWGDQQVALAARREELEKQLKQVQEQLETLRKQYAEWTDKLHAKESLLAEAEAARRKWEQRIDALVSRRDTMQELQNDYDGFQHGVREVLKSKQRGNGLQGIHGAVAELIKVPAKVETAIETALGAAMQNIVVENESNGRAAIAFLKQRQLGRATFLPLDIIRGRSIPDAQKHSVSSMSGYVGVAADLIQFEERYEQIMTNLLGHVIIVNSLEEANPIAAKLAYRFRVVTLEGDVVNPGGSMTGGSLHKKSANLLGRQRQMDELELEIRRGNEQLQQLNASIGKLMEERRIETEQLNAWREQGEALRGQEQKYSAEFASLSNESQLVDDHVLMHQQDGASLQEELQAAMAKKQAAEARIVQLTKQEQDQQAAIREAELARKAKESAREELQQQLTVLKVKTAELTQEKQLSAVQYERYAEEYALLERECKHNVAALQRLDADGSNTDLELVQQAVLLEECKQRKLVCSESIERKREERAAIAAQLELEESKTKEQRLQLKQVEETMHQTEVKVNRLDVELDNILKKLTEEYQMGFELAKSRYPMPEDIEETKRTVQQIKRDIAALGEVNLGAVEEYERVSERFNFLDSQKQDLLEAKLTLYEVIREMDEEMSKRFMTAFEAIRGHFEIVFNKLFGGGRAQLILSEPAHPLDTGIEIVAQPPGKKLQNLQLLSGGERALTAIALLFAILRVKPVPFCVLDEVEAALDEANVSRFAEYLREFSHETQFIVVTHRKGTMEEADVLYGVTMEEGGVSKLVSVRLEEEENIGAEASA